MMFVFCMKIQDVLKDTLLLSDYGVPFITSFGSPKRWHDLGLQQADEKYRVSHKKRLILEFHLIVLSSLLIISGRDQKQAPGEGHEQTIKRYSKSIFCDTLYMELHGKIQTEQSSSVWQGTTQSASNAVPASSITSIQPSITIVAFVFNYLPSTSPPSSSIPLFSC